MNIFNYIPAVFLNLAQYTPKDSSLAGQMSTDQMRKVSAIAALNLALAPLIAYILSRARQADREDSAEAVSKEACLSWVAGIMAPLATSLAKAGNFMAQGCRALSNGLQSDNTSAILAGTSLIVGGYLSTCNHQIYEWQNKRVRYQIERMSKSKIPDNFFFSTIEACGVSALNFALTPLIAFALSKARAADLQSPQEGDTSKEALVACSAGTLAPLATAQAQRRQQHSFTTNIAMTVASYILTRSYPIHQHWQNSLANRLLLVK
jgi:hypothetical protein